MAKPVLTLATISAVTSAMQISNMTSVNGTYDEFQGVNGADWCLNGNGTQNTKRQNNLTCVPKIFNDTGSAATTSGGFGAANVTWYTADATDGDTVMLNGTASTTGTTGYAWPAGQINCGAKFDIPATANLQSFIAQWIIFDTGSTWTVNATLSDSSAAQPAAITLGNSGATAFQINFRALPAGATLHIDVRRTVAGGSSSNFQPRLSYTTVPIARILPTGWSNYLRRKRILGG